MRISDWSSDVCSSDLARHGRDRAEHTGARAVYGVRSKRLQPESAHRRAHAPTGQQPDPVAPERSDNADQPGQEPEPERSPATPGDHPEPSADRPVDGAGASDPVTGLRARPAV